MDRYKQILARYIKMKCKEKIGRGQLQGGQKAADPDAERKNACSRTHIYIKSKVQDIAAQNGLQVKQPDQASGLISDYLNVALDQMLQRTKTFFESDIKWSDIQDYSRDMTAEQREE